MARTKSTRPRILAWALGIGAVLVIVFVVMEYGFGMREYATGLDETPSTTDTTISDTRDGDDSRALQPSAAEGEGEVRIAGTQAPGTQPAEATDTKPGDLESVTVLSALAVTDVDPMMGRAVELDRVRVGEVLADHTFYIEPTYGDERVLVWLEEEPTPGDETEGRYDVTEGQLIDLFGTVNRIPETIPASWGVEDEDADALQTGAPYIHAVRLTIEERP